MSRIARQPASSSTPIFRSSATAIGERVIAFWARFCPHSIRLAIATSCTRVSNGTVPIFAHVKPDRIRSLVQFASREVEFVFLRQGVAGFIKPGRRDVFILKPLLTDSRFFQFLKHLIDILRHYIL